VLLTYTRGGVTYWVPLHDGAVGLIAVSTGLEPCYVTNQGLEFCSRAVIDYQETPEGDEWFAPSGGAINIVDGLYEFVPAAHDLVSVQHGSIVLHGTLLGSLEAWIPTKPDCSVDVDNIRVWDAVALDWVDDWEVVCDGVCLCTKADGTFTVGVCGDCVDGRADDVFSDVNCNLGGLGACCDEDGNCTNETKAACEALGAGYTWTHEALCINGECPNPLP
jgi:hypothetical protein